MHLKSVRFHPDRYPTREHYPFKLNLFHQTAGLDFRTPVTLFVGENGTGKSTLLEAIARRCGIFIWQEGGRTRYNVNLHEDKLCHYISVEWVEDSVPGSFFGSLRNEFRLQFFEASWRLSRPDPCRWLPLSLSGLPCQNAQQFFEVWARQHVRT